MLKPWEAGYVTPPDIPHDHAAAGRKGGANLQAKLQAAREATVIERPLAPAATGSPTNWVPDASELPAPLAYNEELHEQVEAKPITLKQKIFYDLFIVEYIKDFNKSMAYIRAGGSVGHAPAGGAQVYRTPYVQRALMMLREQLEEENIITRTEILYSLKREANYYGDDGSAASRTKALTILAKILGMEAPTKIEQTTTHRGGVMVVPMVASTADWKMQALTSQEALKSDVRK